jgi:branched-chain amino acid transport system substrate-binding protein
MYMKPALACVALVAVLVLAGSAASARTADPGVTPTQIVLGSTAPLSGPESWSASVARGADAYFRFANARGGVHGRRIVYRTLDDASDPAQAAQATRELVERDRVFALVGSVGTEQSLAVREYLNAVRVPQLFAVSGATTLGRDSARYPWTIGYRPSYQAEGGIYGRFLARTRPGARVAVLAEGDELGRELLAGLKRGLARSGTRVVATQTVDVTATDLQPHVARLQASDADVLALFVLSPVAAQASLATSRLGWRPFAIVSSASTPAPAMAAARRTLDGSISATFLKDPTDPRWAKDPGLVQYRTIMARYAKGANARDVGYVYGMAVAYTTVEVLKAAGQDPTRAGVMAKARSLKSASNPFLVPGIVVETGEGDAAPVEQVLLQRWARGAWRSFGGLWR